jgi:hypothetical protein
MKHAAVVSHDAGGAEILSSWLKRTNNPASVVVAGPAEAIFRRKCPQAEFLPLDAALAKSTWVLCGTGWQSSFERYAILRARSLGKRTVAFIDHWVNYRERFIEAGVTTLPDEIWVGDAEAKRIAFDLFNGTPIVLVPNPYFEDIVAEIAMVRQDPLVLSTGRVLYVCEPVADHSLSQYGDERHLGYTERDALNFFLKKVAAVVRGIDAITIRPHPSERADKYHWAESVSTIPVHFSRGNTLLEEILAADIVAGCESMALVVGLLAGKRVISTIPPGGRPCQLPHREIEHMQLLVRDFNHGT